MAQNHGPAALAGTVSSAEEGKMEGVVVSAKRPGSTIMVSVSTNAQGQYSFPQDRLAPGAYDITIRAVGYTLKPTSATIQSGGSAQLDLTLAHRAPIILAAARNNVPAIYSLSEFVRDGGLLSYGPDLVDMYRRAASYVDRILRGEKPGDLPVQFPTKFEMVVNRKTATALGLEIPLSIRVRADEVIE